MATNSPTFAFPIPSPSVYTASMQSSCNKRKRSSSISPSVPSGSANISGRTLKRTRARPNEELIHQYTLAKLFSAAKSSPAPAPTVKTNAFMSLFSRAPPASTLMAGSKHKLSCEECDRGIEVRDEEEEAHCVGCYRVVCDVGCSASNGEGRVCLECVRYR